MCYRLIVVGKVSIILNVFKTVKKSNVYRLTGACQHVNLACHYWRLRSTTPSTPPSTTPDVNKTMILCIVHFFLIASSEILVIIPCKIIHATSCCVRFHDLYNHFFFQLFPDNNRSVIPKLVRWFYCLPLYYVNLLYQVPLRNVSF